MHALTLPHSTQGGMYFCLKDDNTMMLDPEELGSLIHQCMRDGHIPGLAIGIVAGDDCSVKCFGYHDIERQVPVTAHSRFGIQSCTKAFTATVAGILVDRGLLEWDRPICEYMPAFRMFDPVATAQATMRDLLSHRTGMPFGGHDWLRVAMRLPRQEYLERLPYLAPSQPFRSAFQYSNVMYVVAGAIMEQIAGMNWEAMVRQWLFAPLGMDGSDCDEDDQRIADAGPCGAIISTAEDMCRWLRVHLGTASVPLVSAPTLQQMYTIQIPCRNPLQTPEVEDGGCAMEWFVQHYRGHRLLAHWGGASGPTIVSCMPDEGIGIIVHSTREASPFHAINAVTLSAYDRLLGLEPIPWHERWREAMHLPYLPPAPAVENSIPVTDHSLLGSYHHAGYGTISIEAIDGTCVMQYGTLSFRLAWKDQHKLALTLTGDVARILIDWWGTRLATLHTDTNGTITGIAIPFEPAVAAIVFMRER